MIFYNLKFNSIWYFYIKDRKMVVFPKAKINFGLAITEKRDDGYHDIETIFYQLNFCDALEFVLSDKPDKKDILISSGINTGSKPVDNLVMKAMGKLREKYSFPFLKIHLHKVIPVGAGLGGGSSDAATLIKAINRYFKLSIDKQTIQNFALDLGSDCPFFIEGVPSYATGRGEILTPVTSFLSGYYILLLNPGVAISTREAFQNCRPRKPLNSLTDLITYPGTKWKNLITNDFEDFAIKKHPIIGQLKDGLYTSGALFSLMSGSGSSVYGIFPSKPDLPSDLLKFVIWEGFL
jgi:4-diphosphocytidyl-2-C-methyl-D-erythritol kinase